MDFSNLKELLVDGIKLVELKINGVLVWMAKTFTNQVPISVDTDGSVFNGTGYIENRRLSSSGGLSGSAQNGSVTTGFIPFHGDSTVIRMKGVEWRNAYANYSGHYYVVFYNSSKAKLDYIASENVLNYSHVITVTRDANGIETISFNTEYGDTNALLNAIRKASFIRITAYGKGADFIATINEEIA